MSAIMESDLSDILVFHKVVEKESFTAAGKHLELPTSTISRRIGRLESHLGVRLLQRTTRKLSVTDAGRIYYQRSLRAIDALEAAQEAVGAMQAEPKGLLRVTAPVDFYQLMPSMDEFLRAYPEVEVVLDLSNRYVDLVKEGFDLAVRAGELRDSSLVAKRLDTANFTLVASPGYVKERGMPRGPNDLKDHSCVLATAKHTHATWKLYDKKKKLVNVPVHGRLAVNNLDSVLMAAEAGLGIARLPTVRCMPGIRAKRLVEVLPGACPAMGSISAVYPSREHMSPALRAFIDHLVENLRLREERDLDLD